MQAVSRIQMNGVPLDMEALERLQAQWNAIQDQLIADVDRDYNVYDGRTFKASRWEAYLVANDIPWPRLESGRLDLCDATFREMARTHLQVAPIRELRSALSEMRLASLQVGDDGRNRCLLSPFSARTGRNQPSNSKFIFGPSVWLRGLIRPRPGWGLAYVDWSQQEFGIAAALSGDPAMMEAYRSGDPYLAFAIQAGAVPRDGHKEDARGRARAVQGVRAGGAVRHGRSKLGSAYQPTGGAGAPTPCAAPADLQAVLEMVGQRGR